MKENFIKFFKTSIAKIKTLKEKMYEILKTLFKISIANRNNKILLATILTLIFTYNIWVKYLNTIVVAPFLSLIEPSTTKNIVWYIAASIIVISSVRSIIKGYATSGNTINYSIILSLFYAYFRYFKTDVWIFTSLHHIEYIKYADIIIITV